MSCSFWNMRRRLRKQLGIERAVAEEKVIADIATAQEKVKEAKEEKAQQTEAPKTETKTVKKGGAKKNDNTTN